MPGVVREEVERLRAVVEDHAPQSVTDQIFIKANRIRSLEIKGMSMVDEGIRPEFIAIVNYGVIGLIQLALGFADTTEYHDRESLGIIDKYIAEDEGTDVRQES